MYQINDISAFVVACVLEGDNVITECTFGEKVNKCFRMIGIDTMVYLVQINECSYLSI